MRFLAFAVMLALIPAASAQMSPSGALNIELDLEAQELDAGETTNLTVFLELDCPLMPADMMGAYVAELRVKSEPGLIITGPTSSTMDGNCVQSGYLWAVFAFQVFVDEAANGTQIFVVEGHAQSPNEQMAGSPDDVHATQAIAVRPKATMDAAPEPEPEPLEENAPGPALPLLLAGLVALARRRQA